MFLFSAYFLIIFAPYRSFYLMYIGAFLGAIIFPITVATYLTIFHTIIPSDKIGRVMSIDHTISMAIAPIGAIITGPAVELIGIYPLLFICALAGIINPIIIWSFTKIRYLDHIENLTLEPFRKPEVIKLENQEL